MTLPILSPAAVRAIAGLSCQCKGECGTQHSKGRCRCGGSGGSYGPQMTVIGQKQYCRKCKERITA